MPSKQRMQDVNRVFHEFADVTSMHGVPRIINSRSLTARIFWSVICLAAFGMFLWQCGILLTRYYSYPKKVNMEIIQRPVPFPAVSVCNVDHLDLIYAKQIEAIINSITADNYTESESEMATILANLSKPQYDELKLFEKHYNELHSNMMEFLPVYEQLYSRGGVDHILEAMSRLGLVANMNYDIVSKAGVQKEDFLISCRFMDEACTLSSSFTKIYDPYYFNCFTFNLTQRQRESRVQGIEYGLSLLLYTGSAGQVQIKDEGSFAGPVNPGMEEADSALAAGKGARVVVHTPETRPYPTAEGYDVPPNFSVTIGVKASKNVRITSPHGKCTSNKLENDPNFKYTLISCQKDCIQQQIMDVCRCVDSRISIPSKNSQLPYCFQVPQINSSCMSLMHQGYLTTSVHMDDDAQPDSFNYDGMELPIPGADGSEFPGGEAYYDGEIAYYDGEDPTANWTEEEKQALAEECRATAEKWHRMMNCRREVYDRMITGDLSAMNSCNCYPPCEDIVYDSTYSLSTLPDQVEEHKSLQLLVDPFYQNLSPAKKEILARSFKNDLKCEENCENEDREKIVQKGIMRHIARINVHIADGNVIKTSEAPDYELIRLVSDIGGQLGLWIGISVMTLFEVLQLIADVFRFRKTKTRGPALMLANQ